MNVIEKRKDASLSQVTYTCNSTNECPFNGEWEAILSLKLKTPRARCQIVQVK
jgi:hypothetical protein